MTDQTGTRGGRGISRRALLFAAGVGAGVAATRGWDRAARETPALLRPGGEGAMLDDASELSATPVWRHEAVSTAPGDETTRFLLRQIEEARAADRPVIAAGARHSMGGQSIAAEGANLTLTQTTVDPLPDSGTYRVAAGARWRDVIARLDPLGYSPAVMQSNNDFGVASTVSVNAHGWPVPYSGCGATVRSLQLLTGSGRVLTCSRDENAEIFSAVMGGYGLLGIITELELDMVPNRRLAPAFEVVPGDAFGPRFAAALAEDPEISMTYGRLDVRHDAFFEEALMITYRPAPDQSDLPPVGGSGWMSRASRPIFRAQVDDALVKRGRWWVETALGPRLAGETTRNALLNEPVVTLDDRDPARTDILHEYFIPPDGLAAFLAACREAIPNSYQQLLNVTLRFVAADGESLLAYAPGDRIAAVMLFSQEKTARAEADMARVTRLLIDAALAAGGSYYLPYRLHATAEQFETAYPGARDFIRMKRRVDPDLRFSNALWRRYMEPLA